MKIDYKEFNKVIHYKMADIQKFLNDIEVKNEDEKSAFRYVLQNSHIATMIFLLITVLPIKAEL